MSFYPVNFKKGERVNEYELFDCLVENEDTLTFEARDVNSNQQVILEVPVSEIGQKSIEYRKTVLQKAIDIPYLRKLVLQKTYNGSSDMLALEILPPKSVRQYIVDKGKFSNEKLSESICQLLTLAEKLQKRNLPLPELTLDNVYVSTGKVVVDYINSTNFREFIIDFGKIIAVIADDEKLAETLLNQLPIDNDDYDFNHIKARMISIIGGKAENENFSLDTHTVKCPGCNTEYVLSANVCKKCNINLFTGMPVNLRKWKKRKKKSSGSGKLTALMILSAFIAIFAVFSKALGISWMLWTVISGIAFAFLVIIFIVFIGS